MKRLLIVTVIILMIDQVLTPFSYVFSNEEEIFDMQENVTIENEVAEDSEESEKDLLEEIQNKEEDIEETISDTDQSSDTIQSDNEEDEIPDTTEIETREDDNFSAQEETEGDNTEQNVVGDEIEETSISQPSTIVILLAEKLGINWEEDAKYYAELAGIDRSEYEGTREQNEQIRDFLLEHEEEILNGEFDEIIEQKKSEDEETPNCSEYTKETRVAVLAEKLGINWEEDAKYYAELAGIDRSEYEGTREQNEQIRLFFLDNLEAILYGEYEEIIAEMKENDQEGSTGDTAKVETGSVLTGEILTENELTGNIITGNIELVDKGCSDNYHEENGLCELNTKTVDCIQTGGVENSTYVVTGVTITWDIVGGTRNETPVCERKCMDNYHKIGGECESNTKIKDCTQTGGVENSIYIVTGVTTTWDIVGGVRNQAPACKWECKPHYHDSENTCKIDNFQFILVENPNVHTLGSTQSGKKPYDEKIELEGYVDTGYRFMGWQIVNLQTSGSSMTTVDNQVVFNMPDRDVTATPLSEIIEYKIVYRNVDDAVMDNPTTYTIETETFTLNEPIKTGYTFLGWTGSNGSEPEKDITVTKGSTGNKRYTAVWEPKSGITYQVVHAVEKANATTYDVRETEILSGTTDELTQAVAKTYTGFTAKEITQKTIKGDGSTVVRIQYQRNVYTITFDTDGGSEISPITGKYESILTVPPDPIKTGYIFTGWKPSFPSKMPLSGAELVAQWEQGLEVENNVEEELENARKTLNENKIKGQSIYKNVVVSVEALENSFPEGTELRITPITAKAQEEEIKEQLVENTDVTEESELVSFDISFIYTLSDGEEIELQPLEGQTVKVSFNYKYNDILSEANNDDNKELKVYHLEEVIDEEGNKTDEVEVKEVEINEGETRDGKLVIDAEKFSVYTIVTQLYEETNNTRTRRLGIDYFEIETKNPSNSSQCITIMDRNLGATITGNSTSSNTSSYGYYYQRGNNYGFTTQTAQATLTGNFPDVSGYSASQYHSSSWVQGTAGNEYQRRKNNTFNRDLWGGGNDGTTNSYGNGYTNFLGRQGPCPDGWHVPSDYEWSTLITYYNKNVKQNKTYNLNYINSSSDTTNFLNQYLFPKAGYLISNGTWANSSAEQYLMGSSIYSKNKIIVRRKEGNGKLTINTINAQLGIPIRCFKNTYECKPSSSCELLDGTVVANGVTVTAYQAAIVAQGSSCQTVSLTCNGAGILQGYSTCVVDDQNGSIATYTAIITPTPNGYGTVSTGSVTEDEGATISISNNTITIGGTTVIATPTADTAEWDYEFVNWTNNCGNTLTGNCTITANFTRTKKSYLITFKNRDGTTLQTGMVEYGTTPTYTGVTPTKAATQQFTYTFAGWSPTITGVTETATYTAIYDITTNQYTATINVSPSGYGSVSIDSVTKGYGSSITTNGNTLTIGGTEVTATPTTDTAEWDYEFVNWTNNCGNTFTDNCTITANFTRTKKSYLITFNNRDGTPLQTGMVEYGATPTYNGATPTKAATQQYTYTFAGWSPTITGVTETATYTAIYNTTTNPYIATIGVSPSGYGTVSSGSVKKNYGSTITENGNKITIGGTEITATPTAASQEFTYTFSGWNNTCGGTLTENCTITAQFKRTTNQYTITFYDEDGTTELGSSTVDYGTDATYGGTTPTKAATQQYTYEFEDWYTAPEGGSVDDLSNVTADRNVYARYSFVVNPYTATIGVSPSGYGSVSSDSVTKGYGSTITENGNKITVGGTEVTATPTADTAEWDYEFVNWTNNCGNTLTGNCTITANFTRTKKSYLITFKNRDGTTLQTGMVEYGATPSYTGATPTKVATQQHTYTFNGWTPTITSVTTGATYTATYNSTVNQYTVTFYDEDGTTVLKATTAYDYGTPATDIETPTPPVKQGYTFAGWSPTISNVVEDATYTATYTVNSYTLTINYRYQNGNIAAPQYTGTVNYGSNYSVTSPVIEHYTANYATVQGTMPDRDLVVQVTYIPVPYTITITASPPERGSVDEDSVIDVYGSAITINGNTLTVGLTEVTATPTTDTAEWDYEFVNWTNNCGNTLTGNCTITANFTRTKKSYLITFNNRDGTTFQTGMVEYGTTPTYTGATPTKAATQQFTYTFAGWSPTITGVTETATYTAIYSSTVNQYNVTVSASPEGWGTLSNDISGRYDFGAGVFINTSLLGHLQLGSCTSHVGGTNSINDPAISTLSINAIPGGGSAGGVCNYTDAIPATATVQYTYTFSGWNNTCGDAVTHDCTITAEFTRTVNNYNVTFNSNGGTPIPDTQSIAYGSKATRPADPTKNGYTFGGWTLNGNDFDFDTTITGAITLVAKWNIVEYTITYNLNGGTNNENNPSTYTIESGAITLQQPTKVGYTFLGWTGDNGNVAQTSITIPSGSYGNKEYNAVWTGNTNTQYTVYHYVKRVGQSTYELSDTETKYGTTDAILLLSSLAKENVFTCAHYDRGSLTGTESGPGEVVTQTTIRGDGTTKIYLYYVRDYYNVYLTGDEHVDILKINGVETEHAVLECGSEVPVDAVPKPGYHFVRWDREEREEREEEENEMSGG